MRYRTMLQGRYNIKNIIFKYRAEEKISIIKFRVKNSKKKLNKTKIMIILLTTLIMLIIKVTLTKMLPCC